MQKFINDLQKLVGFFTQPLQTASTFAKHSDQPPNCAVFTTTHVMRLGEPITHVFHDEGDHGWQFHSPGEKLASDSLIVALKEIVQLDPTVAAVANLPPGYVAIRSGVGLPWRMKKRGLYGIAIFNRGRSSRFVRR